MTRRLDVIRHSNIQKFILLVYISGTLYRTHIIDYTKVRFKIKFQRKS